MIGDHGEDHHRHAKPSTGYDAPLLVFIEPSEMRRLIPCIVLWSAASAAEPQPWPKDARVELRFSATQPTELPRGLAFDQITFEDREPHVISTCWLDLNRDGTPELLVDTHEGGTGGTYFRIFARTRTGFRGIAQWQGGIGLLQSANGYYQIQSWSSGGGGQFSRALLRFERGKYRCVRLERWRTRPGADEPTFLESIDPKLHEG